MRTNPFNVTKAVDFTDEEIADTWVDYQEDGSGFYTLADPRSPMPRILLGGKGSGRTHLMRYYSASLQRLRHAQSAESLIAEDQYVGIYLRCSGLNAGRFSGKNISDEGWESVFAYYMDLWLAQLALNTALATFSSLDAVSGSETDVVSDIVTAFDKLDADVPTDFPALQRQLNVFQRDLDFSINNAALTRNLDEVQIRVRRGILPFLVPQVFAKHVPALGSIVWLYLLDELENLTTPQQRYVQTLVREKEPPASLMIGSRLYGFRTRRTFSADEENKEGSEFESLQLDEFYLDHPDGFRGFCRNLVAQRLIENHVTGGRRESVAARLEDYFEIPEQFGTDFVQTESNERRYFDDLRTKLVSFAGLTPATAAEVTAALSVPTHPLLEKLNTLLLLQRWTASWVPLDEARAIGNMSREHAAGVTDQHYHQKIKHHRSDVYAQLLRQYRQKQRYVGVDSFITMAGGIPRNLLIILKNIYRWAEFNGENAFLGDQISVESQRSGVVEASEWFLNDSLVMGELGGRVEAAIVRLGGLFRALRFADKPPEVQCSSFAVDASGLCDDAKSTIKTAVEWSLLLPVVGGHKDKNTAAVVPKYNLNPMLCPRFDLSLARGGTLRLNKEEGDAIFGALASSDYDRIHKRRVDRATVPFRKTQPGSQTTLLDAG